ncbi:MAG: hypothetical protein M5R38_12850 [Candidatus Methylomirabilis sp.]|nr:hypothetical protein [Candidatus Methylomirabilis sp.]
MLRRFRISLNKLLDHPFGYLRAQGGQDRFALIDELSQLLITGMVTIKAGGDGSRQLPLVFRREVGQCRHLRQGVL